MISGGRVEFGIGASWLEEEWEVTGLDFHTRGRRVDETIDICRRLWSEDVVEHHGEFFDFAPVMFNPKPVQQPQPSLLIGGDGAAAKRRAALVGDGWLPMNHSLEQLPGALAEINAQRAKRRTRRHHHAHGRRRHRVAAPMSTATAPPTSTVCSCARS